MKKLLLLPVLFFLFSCENEGELTRDGLLDETISETSVLNYTGLFLPTSGITVTGSAKIYFENNSYKLKLDDFSISDGPDLKVYLSRSASPSDFVTLGNLTSSTVYSIPQAVNLASYSHVLIHCQQYNHLFAIAALTQN
ncbi:DM13 domain-containing protein [Flavobacterium soli]|uniref:DM13 domain-containing protein n=1 Tax=Flavobacterium soli TaxID=344881 RepID=UPI0004247F20|nr:DM13 domain-containing protein [Flavobacterium soli]